MTTINTALCPPPTVSSSPSTHRTRGYVQQDPLHQSLSRDRHLRSNLVQHSRAFKILFNLSFCPRALRKGDTTQPTTIRHLRISTPR